jgi:predicted HAD superfamily Cof-like phosphohydrolase
VTWHADNYSGTSPIAAMLDEFHTHPNVAADPRTNGRTLRYTLHREEHHELEDELRPTSYTFIPDAPDGADSDEWLRPERQDFDVAKIARELADVVYVAYGTAWVFGIDLDAALAEIHRAAMDKVNANCKRADGKIIKPPGFVPPDMTRAVRNCEQRANTDVSAPSNQEQGSS